MTKAIRFVVEGVWTGYTAAQRHVVHRTVHFGDPARYEALKAIRYTDGTSLLISVRALDRGERVSTLHGYDTLIADCIRYGVSSVYDLGLAQVAERAKRGGVTHWNGLHDRLEKTDDEQGTDLL